MMDASWLVYIIFYALVCLYAEWYTVYI